MQIRSYTVYDFELTKKLHSEYFKEEFELPNFSQGYLCSYVIENDKESPVVIAGVRPIAELIAVTDLSKSPRDRVVALKEATRAGVFTCHVHGFDQLHCFIQGDQWAKQVQSVHFRPTKGQSFVLDV